MTLVVVLPSEHSDAQASRIASLLRERIGVSLFTQAECSVSPDALLWVVGANPDQALELGEGAILICLAPCDRMVMARRAHLLLGEGQSIPSGILSTQVISLGRGAKNTLTLSSLREDRAMVSLQREIVSLAQQIIEPCEYAVSLPSERALPEALVAAAILLLCGIEPARE